MLPTPFGMQWSIWPSKSLKPKFPQNIHGITTHKVYPHNLLLSHVVSPYLTFSPLPLHKWRGGNFLWHCLYPVPKDETPFVKWCGALRCPDFPPVTSNQRRTVCYLSLLSKMCILHQTFKARSFWSNLSVFLNFSCLIWAKVALIKYYFWVIFKRNNMCGQSVNKPSIVRNQ